MANRDAPQTASTTAADPNATDDVAIAAKNARAENPAQNARQWLLSTHAATLCTTSTKAELEGYPFGSIVPFCLTPSGQPVIFVASIAAHTSNLRKDPRASLFVHDPHAEGDPQKSWRITVMGEFERLSSDEAAAQKGDATWVSPDDLNEIKARYEQRIPFAIDYNSTHDFSFWRMRDVVRVRYIAGFGKICWLDGAEVRPHNEGALEGAQPAIDHMNADHAENLLEIVHGMAGFTAQDAKMIRLHSDGFTIEASGPDRTIFVPFGEQITAAEIRPAIIRVLKAARERIRA